MLTVITARLLWDGPPHRAAGLDLHPDTVECEQGRSLQDPDIRPNQNPAGGTQKLLDQCHSTFFEPQHIFYIEKLPWHTNTQNHRQP